MNTVENFLKAVDLAPIRFSGFKVKREIMAIHEEVKVLAVYGDRTKTFLRAKEGLKWLENCQRLLCRKFLNEKNVQTSMGNFLHGRKLDRDLSVRFEHLLSRLKIETEELLAVENFDLQEVSPAYCFLYRELDSIKNDFLRREEGRNALHPRQQLPKIRKSAMPPTNTRMSLAEQLEAVRKGVAV